MSEHAPFTPIEVQLRDRRRVRLREIRREDRDEPYCAAGASRQRIATRADASSACRHRSARPEEIIEGADKSVWCDLSLATRVSYESVRMILLNWDL